jgi:anti-sigma regulatory factor (Ser/Thr protein kinase)
MVKALAPFGPSARAAYRLEVALEEVFLNTVRHAYDDDAATHSIGISLSADAQGWVLEFEDDGRPFDPTKPAALPSAPLASLEPGGRGLHLLQKSARTLVYRRDGELNRLQICIDI